MKIIIFLKKFHLGFMIVPGSTAGTKLKKSLQRKNFSCRNVLHITEKLN